MRLESFFTVHSVYTAPFQIDTLGWMSQAKYKLNRSKQTGLFTLNLVSCELNFDLFTYKAASEILCDDT